MPRPCVFCKGGHDAADSVRFGIDPCSILQSCAKDEQFFQSLNSTTPDLWVRGSHPCKKRKDGAPSVVVISAKPKGRPPACERGEEIHIAASAHICQVCRGIGRVVQTGEPPLLSYLSFPFRNRAPSLGGWPILSESRLPGPKIAHFAILG